MTMPVSLRGLIDAGPMIEFLGGGVLSAIEHMSSRPRPAGQPISKPHIPSPVVGPSVMPMQDGL